MNIQQFMAIATTETTEQKSINNPNTIIVSKSFSKSLYGVNLKHIRQAYVSNGKVVTKRRLFKVNNIGVCRRAFLKEIN